MAKSSECSQEIWASACQQTSNNFCLGKAPRNESINVCFIVKDFELINKSILPPTLLLLCFITSSHEHATAPPVIEICSNTLGEEKGKVLMKNLSDFVKFHFFIFVYFT
jgi:hypothetical protein